jgi:cytoskeletal protein RodZ
MNDQRKLWGVVLIVIGFLAVVVGIIYLTVYARSLPGFLGPVHNYPGHRSNRGTAALILGLVLLGGGAWLVWAKPRAADSEAKTIPPLGSDTTPSTGSGSTPSTGTEPTRPSAPEPTPGTEPTPPSAPEPTPPSAPEPTPPSDTGVSRTPPPTP